VQFSNQQSHRHKSADLALPGWRGAQSIMTKTGMLFNTDLESLFASHTIDEIEKLSQGLKQGSIL
jgi:hypothetical protein